MKPFADETLDRTIDAFESLGAAIFLDDEQDWLNPARRFAYSGVPGVKDHPSPLHHWQIGMAMMAGAKLVRMLVDVFDMLDGLRPPSPLEDLLTWLDVPLDYGKSLSFDEFLEVRS